MVKKKVIKAKKKARYTLDFLNIRRKKSKNTIRTTKDVNISRNLKPPLA